MTSESRGSHAHENSIRALQPALAVLFFYFCEPLCVLGSLFSSKSADIKLKFDKLYRTNSFFVFAIRTR